MPDPGEKTYTVTEEQYKKLQLIDKLNTEELESLIAVIKELSRR